MFKDNRLCSSLLVILLLCCQNVIARSADLPTTFVDDNVFVVYGVVTSREGGVIEIKPLKVYRGEVHDSYKINLPTKGFFIIEPELSIEKKYIILFRRIDKIFTFCNVKGSVYELPSDENSLVKVLLAMDSIIGMLSAKELDNDKFKVAWESSVSFSKQVLIHILRSRENLKIKCCDLNAIVDIVCVGVEKYDPRLRLEILWFLGTVDYIKAKIQLVNVLNDKNENIRFTAIEGLKKYNSELYGYDYKMPSKESIDKWKIWIKKQEEIREQPTQKESPAEKKPAGGAAPPAPPEKPAEAPKKD